ncbi:GNAT family N-acetyltransferase [Roseovarius sp. SCSIO 43702]|nr:GNAT family N-acetyltransferase [Roseovarius sp. SCSIO 43702]
MLRAATPDDASAIAALWAPVVRDTPFTFTATPRTADDIAADIVAKSVAGHAFLVAEHADALAGFATYAQFRPGAGYARTMEHTIILAPDHRGQGRGRALLSALIEHARAAGVSGLVAGISAENPGAIAFHERMGFTRAGVIPKAGYKFDREIDLLLLHRSL